ARSATQPATAPTTRPSTTPSNPPSSTPPMTPPSNARMTTTMSGLLTSSRPVRAQSFGTDRRIENGQQLRGLQAPAQVSEVIAGMTERLISGRPAVLEQPLVRNREADRTGTRSVLAIDRAERARTPADLQIALARVVDDVLAHVR